MFASLKGVNKSPLQLSVNRAAPSLQVITVQALSADGLGFEPAQVGMGKSLDSPIFTLPL